MSLNKKHKIAFFAYVAAQLSMGIPHAHAQPKTVEDIMVFQKHDVDHSSTVGIPFGGFFLNTGFTYNSIYDDNVFLRENNPTTDWVNIFKPGMSVQTNWGRHEIFLGAQATRTDYRTNSQKDALDYGTILSGRYDITYETYVDAYVIKSQRNLNRGSDEDIDGTDPIKYESWSSRIGFTRALSYIQTKLSAFHDNMERRDDLSSAVAGDFLKRDKNGLEATLTYEYFPKNNIYVTMNHTNIDYNIVGGDTRIVNKSELKYGLNFAYADIYSGSLGFGHLRTNYSDLDVESDDPYVMANLSWFPTALSTVTLSMGRSYVDGSISANEKVAVDTARVGVSHKFTEFVTGNVTGSIVDNAYEALAGGTLRENRVYSLGADAKYQVSDNLGLKLGYEFKERTSETANQDYKNNRILFTLTYMH